MEYMPYFKGDFYMTKNLMLEKFIDDLIGSINCEEDKNINKEYINKLEFARIDQSRNVVLSLLKNIPKEKLVYIYNKDTRALMDFNDIDTLDIQILLSYTVLCISEIIKNKNLIYLRHYNDKILLFKDIDDIDLIHSIIYSAYWYDNKISELIDEEKENINKLLKSNHPTFDFPNLLTELPYVYKK